MTLGEMIEEMLDLSEDIRVSKEQDVMLKEAARLLKWMSDEIVSADEAFEDGNDMQARQYIGVAAGRIYQLRGLTTATKPA